MNSIGIRREISSRENPRFPPLRNFQSILFQPSTVGIIYTDTISNTRCRRKCRSAVNVCKLRRERSEITGRPELLLGSLLPSSPFFLIFYRSPAIHPTISVNLNLAQTTRASSILARHFPRGIKLKIESKFRASFFFFFRKENCNTRIADQTTRNYSFKLHLLYSLFLYLTFLSASSVLFIIKIQRKWINT